MPSSRFKTTHSKPYWIASAKTSVSSTLRYILKRTGQCEAAVVGEEGIEFEYQFHGKPTHPPMKYLSESHLYSLGSITSSARTSRESQAAIDSARCSGTLLLSLWDGRLLIPNDQFIPAECDELFLIAPDIFNISISFNLSFNLRTPCYLRIYSASPLATTQARAQIEYTQAMRLRDTKGQASTADRSHVAQTRRSCYAFI